MTLDRCPPEFVMLGHQLADAVRPITKNYFKNQPDIDYKSDNSPVTIADREAEVKIREIITKKRPQDGILGEEFGETNTGAEFRWIIDPIDGTKPFTIGKATFGTLIALAQKNDNGGEDIIFGLCDQSVTGDRWTGAKGHPTLWNGHAVKARKNVPDDLLLGACINPLRFEKPLQEKLSAVNKNGAVISCGGDCLNYCLLASGRLDFVIETKQEIYDIAALIPIITGAGAQIRKIDGTAFTPGDPDTFIVTADERVLEMFIEE